MNKDNKANLIVLLCSLILFWIAFSLTTCVVNP